MDKDEKKDNNENIVSEKSEKEELNEKVEYVPEQLEDDDFEKEKEKEKAEKKAKKLAKKEEKLKKENGQDEKTVYDEEGNPIKNSKSKKFSVKILIIVLILLIVVVGIVAYFIISLNRPENIVNDFIIYFNNDEWDNVADCVDMQGYLTMSLIDTEAAESDESSSNVSYMDYDSRYETVYDDLKEAGYYDAMMEIINYGEENNSEILSTMFEGYSLNLESVKSVEKIENTDSLYKITALCTMEYGGENQTNTYEIYVSKVDGKYKLVGGDLPYLVYTAYIYYQYYNSMSY